MKWDYVIQSWHDNRAIMAIKMLFGLGAWQVHLHKFLSADMRGCYHTHPAFAIRIVLFGGYVEELEDGTMKLWTPGSFGIVRPEMSHRIHELLNGRNSYSLWLRAPAKYRYQLRGEGWPPHLKDTIIYPTGAKK